MRWSKFLLVSFLCLTLLLSGCFLSREDEGNSVVLTFDFLHGSWRVQNLNEFLSCTGGTLVNDLEDPKFLFAQSENGFEGAFLFGHNPLLISICLTIITVCSFAIRLVSMDC